MPLILTLISLVLHGYQQEAAARLDFQWRRTAREEEQDMAHLQAYNRKLLANILPAHVADYFLTADRRNEVSYVICHFFLLLSSYRLRSR
ncbi:ADCY5 [Cordylochernes scorpioides]|nr:ADCY5 [Cordylochernes scorpioides]